MNTRLRKAGERHAQAQLERGKAHAVLANAVRAAHAEGMGPTEIAEVAGVSRQTVHTMLNPRP